MVCTDTMEAFKTRMHLVSIAFHISQHGYVSSQVNPCYSHIALRFYSFTSALHILSHSIMAYFSKDFEFCQILFLQGT